jgi:large subunit ribosomal protein L33
LREQSRPLLSPALETRPCPAARAAMAKPKKKKEIVFLVCEETGDRNYTIMKKPGTNKLELMKYSPRVRKHTKHIEKKK